MKYRLTPLNILCALLLGFELLFFVVPETLDKETYGYHHIYLIPVIIIGLVIDFMLQKLFNQYYLLILVELALLATTMLLNTDF